MEDLFTQFRTLIPAEQTAILFAISDFVDYGVEPTYLTKVPLAVWENLKPHIRKGTPPPSGPPDRTVRKHKPPFDVKQVNTNDWRGGGYTGPTITEESKRAALQAFEKAKR